MAQAFAPTIGNAPLQCANNDEAFARSLEVLLNKGHEVDTFRRSDPAKSRKSLEILNFQVSIANSRDRILLNTVRSLNVVGTVARFVWMLAGNDRLEDIAFYEPKVRNYTDNGISVPGSSYGKRLFQTSPNVNQMDGIVRTLETEAGSRRSAAVIWTAEDAIRTTSSKDIPCAFGIFYHVRGDRLISTTIMRSNNAYILSPIISSSLVCWLRWLPLKYKLSWDDRFYFRHHGSCMNGGVITLMPIASANCSVNSAYLQK